MGKIQQLFLWISLLISHLCATDIVDVHGFVSQGFFISNTYNIIAENSLDGSWELREVGINVQRDLGNRFHVGLQLLSRDVGIYGNNKVVLDWAFGSCYITEQLTFSAGRVKNPTGFYGEIQDFDFLFPWIQLPSTLYHRGLRTLSASLDGIKANGSFDLKGAGSIDYALLLGTYDFGPSSDIEAYATHNGLDGVDSINIKFKTTSNIIYNTPIDGLRLNFTWSHTNETDFTFTTLVSGMSGTINRVMEMNWFFWGIQYNHAFFDLVSEYYSTYSPFTMNVAIDGVGTVMTQDTISRGGGGYVGASVRPKEWLSFSTYYQMYWDYYDPSSVLYTYDKNDDENINRDLAFTVGFNIRNNVVIKGEIHTVKGLALLPVKERIKNLDASYQYGLLKVSFNF